MIPTIETIVDNLIDGFCTSAQAVTWLHQHAADAGRDLRDGFAAAALSCAMPDKAESLAEFAYAVADAMLKERTK
jgi:hypothetical protein